LVLLKYVSIVLEALRILDYSTKLLRLNITSRFLIITSIAIVLLFVDNIFVLLALTASLIAIFIVLRLGKISYFVFLMLSPFLLFYTISSLILQMLIFKTILLYLVIQRILYIYIVVLVSTIMIYTTPLQTMILIERNPKICLILLYVLISMKLFKYSLAILPNVIKSVELNYGIDSKIKKLSFIVRAMIINIVSKSIEYYEVSMIKLSRMCKQD